MGKITNKFIEWCADPSDAARLQRTIAQGIIAALAVGITTGEWGASVGVAVIMAVITPIQAAIGEADAPAGKHARGE